jgi:hypothetical protein
VTFNVYIGIGSVNYAVSVATVTYRKSRTDYETVLSGMTPGSTYLVGVRATNSFGEELNTVTISGTPSAALSAVPVAYGSATVGLVATTQDPDGFPSRF